jgi:hypothetical protein
MNELRGNLTHMATVDARCLATAVAGEPNPDWRRRGRRSCGTAVTWVSTFELKAPMLRGPLTKALAPGIALGFRTVLWTADRKLTGQG